MKSFLRNIILWKATILARLTLYRFKPFVVAITGSAGKTSAKEALYTILSSSGSVRRSEGNFNTEFGVPLTIMGGYRKIWHPVLLFWAVVFVRAFFGLFKPSSAYPSTLILEYGADKPGDISKLLDIAKPNIAVITSIGDIPVHVEYYHSGPEAVAKEKLKLVGPLTVSDVAVVNVDDKSLSSIQDKTRGRIVRFGFSEKADVRISNFSHMVQKNVIEGISFKLESDGVMVPVVVSDTFSVGHAYAIAAAVCVAREHGVNIVESANIISNQYRPMRGRSLIVNGVKRTRVIDESYNSSPVALFLALKTLESISGIRRVAVVGDMTELGEFTIKAHEKAGEAMPGAVDVLVTVGDRAALAGKKAIQKGMKEKDVYFFDTSDEAAKKIHSILRAGDLVIVKGSRVIELDKVVDAITV